jgi:hypothetical protein
MDGKEAAMSFCDDLAPLLTTFRDAARKRYVDDRGRNQVTIHEDGSIRYVEHDGNIDHRGDIAPNGQVHILGHPSEAMAEFIRGKLREEYTAYNSFLADLDTLVSHLEAYFDLDTEPYEDMSRSLSDEDLGSGHFTVASGTGNAFQRLQYAWTGPVRRGPNRAPWESNTTDLRWDNDFDVGMAEVEALAQPDFWTGTAATTFHDQFLDPFRKKAQPASLYCILLLHNVLATYREHVKGIQKDLKAIVRLGTDVFNFAEDTEANMELAGLVLSWVAFVAGLAGQEEIAIPVELTALTIHTDEFLTADETNGGSKKWKIDQSPYPKDILDGTWNQIRKLENQIASIDDEIRRRLDTFWGPTSWIHGRFGSEPADTGPLSRARLDRPDIASRSDNWGNPNPGSAAADPGAPTVAVPIVRLYQAGYANLPFAANQYNEVVGILNSLQLPATPFLVTAQSRQKFFEARDDLSRQLAGIRDSLIDTGANMVTAAKSFQITDEHARDGFNQITQMMTSPASPYHVTDAPTDPEHITRAGPPPPDPANPNRPSAHVI